MALAAKDVFDDRYVIEGLLGEGGMGAVFAAYDTRLRRRVALKVLPNKSREDAEAAERLVREARAAATLDHPNVVAVFDVGRVESTPFIAMELVEGRSLRALIGRSEVSLAAKIRWITDVARALSAAHDKHLVHRDIKPSNVLVRDDGVVKVVDFGVARRVKQEDTTDDSATITKEGAIVGTHQYMAPEVLRGEPADERSDQFSWAVLAYELVTGELPWRVGKTAPDVIAAILLQPAAPLGAIAEMPSEVEQAILRALSKTPAKRFASMGDVVLALEPHVSNRSSALPKELGASFSRGDETLTKHTVSLPNVVPPRRRAWALAPLLVAIALGVAWAQREPAPLSATRAIVEPRVVTVTDLPVPTLGKSEAIAEYRAAMQAFRDGAYATSIQRFRSAANHDPTLAAAQLRLAIATFYASASTAREHFNKAFAHRSALSDHDRILLDAYEPYIRKEPGDVAERDQRLRAAVARFPYDADFALYHARARDDSQDPAVFDPVIRLDPKFGLAYAFKLQSERYRGDHRAALRTFKECMRQAPAAMFCLSQKSALDTEIGDCKALAEDGRQLMAHEPSLEYGYYRYAEGSAALGEPLEAVRQALALAWSRESIYERATASARDRFNLDVLAGNFAAAEQDARELEKILVDDPNRPAHAGLARWFVQLYLETGREAAAVAVAEDFLQRQSAWAADPRSEDFAIARDVTPQMLAVIARAKNDAKFEEQRRAWVKGWRARTYAQYVPYLWVYGYAMVAETPAEARVALDALPQFAPLPRVMPETLADAHIGRVHLLAGEIDKAFPPLERATKSCYALIMPFEHTQAHLSFGEALEKKGDKERACAAYQTVLRRWGKATQRSTTMEEARRRSGALGCSGL